MDPGRRACHLFDWRSLPRDRAAGAVIYWLCHDQRRIRGGNRQAEAGHVWIDDQPDPLHTAADVAELFKLVEEKKAALRTAAIERASRN